LRRALPSPTIHIVARTKSPNRIRLKGAAGGLPADRTIPLLKKSIAKNQAAVDSVLGGIRQLKYDRQAWLALQPVPKPEAQRFDKIIQYSIENRGEEISVDEISDYTTVPAGTAKKEKRGVAVTVSVWDSKKCVQCAICSILCPHGVIRPFLLTPAEAGSLTTIPATGKGLKGLGFRIQISPLDCTGCGVCKGACPAGALSMVPIGKVVATEQKNFDICTAAKVKGSLVPKTTVRGSQFQQPLLEFNGASPGCGEPAIMKLLTQLYGDRLLIACATGGSLVWGATYPFNPWCTNDLGQGPAWANSPFEDNAEFGYRMYHAVQARRDILRAVIERVLKNGSVSGQVKDLLTQILPVWDEEEKSIAISNQLQPLLKALPDTNVDIKRLKSQPDVLAKKTIWIMGGDESAYDIGYGGLDHVLVLGEDVNVIVLDTEVYSNTGGQCSKATQRGAVANFSAAGYLKQKKDLGAIAITYGNIYVASTCLLADQNQALKALLEAHSSSVLHTSDDPSLSAIQSSKSR
jgi:pyruvate-ferredoxin/flavodoxin oxidoreductase